MSDDARSDTGERRSPLERVKSGYGRLADHRTFPFVVGVLGFSALAALPYLLNVEISGVTVGNFVSLKTLLLTIIFAYLAQSWNLMSGFTGYFSFGHAAFFGIGAYTTQILLVDHGVSPWVGMAIGGVIAVVFGLFIGGVSFQYELKGHYFALATIAFAELLRYVVINVGELNGPNGYYKPFPTQYADGYGLLAFQFRNDLPYFYIILAFLLVVTVVGYLVKNTWVGLYLFAIREDEQAAASLGVPVYRYKLFGVAVSALFTAFGGSFWSMYFNTIRPDTVFDIFKNVDIILPAVIGGPGTLVGPIIGAFAVMPVSEFLRATFDDISGLDRIIFGLVLLVIPIFTPRGMVSWPRRFREFRTWLYNHAEFDSDGRTTDSAEVER